MFGMSRRPILFAADSANHMPPSLPSAIPIGCEFDVGTGNSKMSPVVVIWATRLPLSSVNYSVLVTAIAATQPPEFPYRALKPASPSLSS